MLPRGRPDIWQFPSAAFQAFSLLHPSAVEISHSKQDEPDHFRNDYKPSCNKRPYITAPLSDYLERLLAPSELLLFHGAAKIKGKMLK